LNVPIGAVGMVLTSILIKNYREAAVAPFDWLGFVLTGVALAAVLYSLDLASHGSLEDGIFFLVLMLGGLGMGWIAVLHAWRHPSPLIALSLFRHPTFALSVWGGIFWRIAAGSVPFLLPVFLQVGLGMTAFASGLLILTDALGNLAMNAAAPAIIRRWGFRRVLVWNGVLSAIAIAGSAAIGGSTPVALVSAAYFLFGFLRSLQYNALSTLQYADVEAREMSAATSFASMTQQMCTGAGIAVGAVLLQLVLMAHGGGAGGLSAPDIRIVFVAEAVCAFFSIPFFRRLSADAGAEVSGHRAALPARSAE
ncbi:MAG: MFS transporter, partial [Stellaceae bacterium]